MCLVVHFRHTPRSREEAGKQQFEALPQCLSLSHSIRRLGAILSMYKLNLYIKAKCIFYLIEELNDAYTDNSEWEEAFTGVRQY